MRLVVYSCGSNNSARDDRMCASRNMGKSWIYDQGIEYHVPQLLLVQNSGVTYEFCERIEISISQASQSMFVSISSNTPPLKL